MRKRLGAKQEARAGFVVAIAARKAGVEPDELLSALERDPEREELLVRTLRVAHDTALLDKLVALSLSLASGHGDADSAQIAWEASFVRALADCDHAHLKLLRSFEAPGMVHDQNMLQALAPEIGSTIDPLLSTLERHGLLRSSSEASGLMGLRIAPGGVAWRMTKFGSQFLTRMAEVGQVLKRSETP